MKLKQLITEEDIANGYIEDDSEDGICEACKEHSSPSYEIEVDEAGNVSISDNYLSSCCGYRMWIP